MNNHIFHDKMKTIDKVQTAANTVHFANNGMLLSALPISLSYTVVAIFVDAIIGNQAFNHGRCNKCSGLSYIW